MSTKKIIFGIIILVLVIVAVAYFTPFTSSPGNRTAMWKTTTDASTGYSYEYPESLPQKYISVVDWPPKLQLIDQAYTCTEAGEETARAGKTEKQIVGGTEYCVTKVSEGAAGSVYTQYAYMFPKEGKTAILTFSLRFVQCGNYDEQQKNTCEEERKFFTIDSVLDEVARSLARK